MHASAFSHDNPFDPLSGDLLPDYREAYLQGRLDPALAHTVEDYLKSSPIQTNIVLGRAHALTKAAQRREHPVELQLPPWVRQQMRFQPTASATGPLRRPVVRLVLGLFLALLVASGVQWLRNEPLLPAPVAKAVVQAARATQRLVRRLTAPVRPAVAAAPARPAHAAPAKAAVGRTQPAQPRAQLVRVVLPARAAALVTQPADSLAASLPAPVVMGTVHGRISDAQGHPLAGATVLVQGTDLVASANAAGDYLLAAPVGATLQFGYGGYTDQLLPNAGAGTVNITLHTTAPIGRHARR